MKFEVVYPLEIEVVQGEVENEIEGVENEVEDEVEDEFENVVCGGIYILDLNDIF